MRLLKACLLFFLCCLPAGSVFSAGEDPVAWLQREKFLGIRCVIGEKCIRRAHDMGLNAVFVADGFVLEPGSGPYENKMSELKRASKLSKALGMHFFMGWRALGTKSIKVGSANGGSDSRICPGDPVYWNRVFAEPMARVAEELGGGEYQLDGFIFDIENYSDRKTLWTADCSRITGKFTGRGMRAVQEKVSKTRESLWEIKPGLLFGLYPVKQKLNNPVVKAWLRGLSDGKRPALLLTEYTYGGYGPELDLEAKTQGYEKAVGNPVLLVAGFNFLKTPEPSAWGMHLYSFARETGGYWLYPGNQLVGKAGVKPGDVDSAYASVRETNREIRMFISNPSRGSALDYRRQRPEERDKGRLKNLLDLSGEVVPIGGGKALKAAEALLTVSDVELLIRAGPGEPIDFSVRGSGYYAVYDPEGNPVVFEEFGPGRRRVRLSVKSTGVYPVIVEVFGKRRRAALRIKNRFWAFRGVRALTSQGRTPRLLMQPRQSPLYFFVPKGTRFFRVFIRDKKRGIFSRVKDPGGRVAAIWRAGLAGKSLESAFQDIEVEVPGGQDGKVWSLEGSTVNGLPSLSVYGVPDLFNTDPERLLIVDEKALKTRSASLDSKRMTSSSGATRIWIEAEELMGGPWWLSRAVPGTSGEGAMFARGVKSAFPLYGDVLVPHSGSWSIWVRALRDAKGTRSRALTVEVSGARLKETHTRPSDAPALEWESAGTVGLEAGRETLKLHSTSGGRPMADVIVFTDDPGWVPQGTERPQ
jgi:hypothetical protein